MEIDTHQELAGAVGLFCTVPRGLAFLVSREHYPDLRMVRLLYNPDVVLRCLPDLLSLPSSLVLLIGHSVLCSSFTVFQSCSSSSPLNSSSLPWLWSQLADTSFLGLTIHAHPAESLLSWPCSCSTQQDSSFKQKKKEGICLTASGLAKCLPLNLPTLPSTAPLGTVPDTSSFSPPS